MLSRVEIVSPISSDWVNLDQNGNSGLSTPQNAQSPVVAQRTVETQLSVPTHQIASLTIAISPSASIATTPLASAPASPAAMQATAIPTNVVAAPTISSTANNTASIALGSSGSQNQTNAQVTANVLAQPQTNSQFELAMRETAVSCARKIALELAMRANATAQSQENSQSNLAELREAVARFARETSLEQVMQAVAVINARIINEDLGTGMLMTNLSLPVVRRVASSENDDTVSVSSEMPDYSVSNAGQNQTLVARLELLNRELTFREEQAITHARAENNARQIAEQRLEVERIRNTELTYACAEEANQRIAAVQAAEAERIRRETAERQERAAHEQAEQAMRDAAAARIEQNRQAATILQQQQTVAAAQALQQQQVITAAQALQQLQAIAAAQALQQQRAAQAAAQEAAQVLQLQQAAQAEAAQAAAAAATAAAQLATHRSRYNMH